MILNIRFCSCAKRAQRYVILMDLRNCDNGYWGRILGTYIGDVAVQRLYAMLRGGIIQMVG
jgi:hypothetical protein